MGATTQSLMSFEEFERLPDQPGKRELLKGELIELPPAGYSRNDIAERLFLAFRLALEAAHARGNAVELGRAHHEMGYVLSGDGYVQPDVSVTHPEQVRKHYYEGAPA